MQIHKLLSVENPFFSFDILFNLVVTGNVNVANQINVMNGIGRKKRRSLESMKARVCAQKLLAQAWKATKKEAAKVSAKEV